jgi:hypothetical protein
VDGMSEVLKDIINALRNGTVPAEGTEYIAVGIDEELKEIESQLEYVRKDKSAFKFIIGDYGSGKTFFSTAVREMAFSKNFVVSSVVISSEAPLHNFEELYRKIMGGLRVADNKKIPAFSVILEEWLLDLEDKVSAIEGISPEDNEEEFKKAMDKKINEELLVVGSIASSFANAIRAFYDAKYKGDTILAQAAVGWLKGENIGIEIKRKLGVTGSVKRENSFEFFRALLHMIKSTGYEGLVIILDEVETVQKLPRKDMRDQAYENLRLFIDETDRNGFPNCYFLYTGTDELMESEKGFKSYEPIYQRVKVEKDDKHRNLRQPLIYLEKFNNDKLIQVSKKVKQIHGQVYNWSPDLKITEHFIEKLVKEVTSGFGGEIRVGPRGYLRVYVDILDKAQMYDDYIPEEQFKFNDELINKAVEVEKETAHIVNF